MRVVNGLLGLMIGFAMFASSGNAAVVLSFGAPQTFAANSGIQSINVFANSTLGAGESAISMGADFALSGTAIFNAPNAGTFGGVGFIGNGNIVAGSSSFDRDTINTGLLSIIFNNPQTVGAGPLPLATLLVDTTGLAAGPYTISVSNGFFGLGSIADTTGTFNISAAAVPEPGSMISAGLGLVGLLYGRRRFKKSAVANS